jgi:cytochrome c biogenesis protein CcdA
MKKFAFVFVMLFLVSFVGAVEVPQTNISYFYSTTCSHCKNVEDSGILEEISVWENVNIEKYEVTLSQRNREKFLDYLERLNLDSTGIPFLVIEQGGGVSYLRGEAPIIGDVEDAIINFRSVETNGTDPHFIKRVTLFGVVSAALIDSINPCAFGVLLFLMAVLLSMGSSKRAFRAAMIYTFVIFLVYFLLGVGIRQLISSFSILGYVQIIAGVIILVGGIIEFKDFFWEDKGFSLKIPKRAKPLLEKYVRRGTLPAIIILGFLVALVELPCTGGIYLGVLTLLSINEFSGIIYLLIYNFIFVLPLILISYLIYRGAEVDTVNRWVQGNKRFMRLAAGIIMVLLALKLLGIF